MVNYEIKVIIWMSVFNVVVAVVYFKSIIGALL